MGLAYFVSFEREIPDIKGWDMCGKTLARNIEALDKIAKKQNLQPLGDMVSASREDVEGLLGEDWEEPELPQIPPQMGKKLPEPVREQIAEMVAEVEQNLQALKKEGIPEEQWFAPSDGLKTVRGLLIYVQDHPRKFKQSSLLLDDLREVEHYLAVAETEQVRFHLTPDF